MALTRQKLEDAVGKPIEKICPNKFHDHASNHCAHFASHMCDMRFSFNCKEFKGGNEPGANIRVHEVFALCGQVGKFDDADKSRTQLVFVTRKDNVDLGRKWMGNIPQKHIGVYCDGHIYHYSNTAEQATKFTPKQFLDTFQSIYAGDQGLFFGLIPGEDLLLTVDPDGANVSSPLPFKLENRGGKWFAHALKGSHQGEFLVGRDVNQAAQGYHGICLPVRDYYGKQYDSDDYVDQLDHWARLLEVTAECESQRYFNLVNTYDRAKFTYGFYQLAAHTPADNLILLFRELLRLPKASDYFPELILHSGRVHRKDSQGALSDLETVFSDQLQFFMNFLNPRRVPIDEQEVLNAARLMHWTEHAADCREAQVRVSGEILQRKMMGRYHKWYGLNGKSDTLCAIIADIHHQGRASKATVQEALGKPNKEKALLEVNNAKWEGRNKTLKAKIEEMKDRNLLGVKKYDAALNEFVDA